jgi:hypothetical protein
MEGRKACELEILFMLLWETKKGQSMLAFYALVSTGKYFQEYH